MTLAAGSRLGPYEIVAPIGAGGMGEVYRAKDPRLGREVAIKVLPASFSNDADRLRRFEQEARSAGILNHPNITAVHDIGTVEGAPYIVTELLEGETLRSRMSGGALAPRRAIDYALHIAHGLAAAHGKGIVHRDLKPENLFVTKDERVKILDFGLAKLTQPDSVTLQTNLPTASEGTEPGVVLGTLGYMSPEQVRGRPADARSDIFSFGAVLYEMLSGQRAFRGDSAADTMSAILREDPPDLSTTNRAIAPGLDRIVRHCLEKSPEARFHSAHDLAFHLEALSDSSAPDARTVLAPRPRKLLTTPALVAAAIIALLLGPVAYFAGLRTHGETAARPARFAIPLPPGTTFSPSEISRGASISPDGTRVVIEAFSEGRRRLFLRPLDSEKAVALEGSEDATAHFWSPDGRFIAFFADGKLKKIPSTGGPPEEICDAPFETVGAWSRDGTILISRLFPLGLFQVSDKGGEARPLVMPDPSRKEAPALWPTFLPDGRRFLYIQGLMSAEGRTGTRELRIGSLDSKEVRTIARMDSRVEYSPTGHLVYVRDGALFTQEFDEKKAALHGDPQLLSESVDYFFGPANAAFSVSNNGVLVFETAPAASRLVWVDRTGRELGQLGQAAVVKGLRISPDGARVAVDVAEKRTGTSDIWVFDANGVSTRLHSDPVDQIMPIWWPDGSKLVFRSDERGPPDIHEISVGSVASERPLYQKEAVQQAEDISRDGRMLVFLNDFQSTSDVWLLSLVGERKASAWLRSRFKEASPRFSPDGRWIAYESDESGQPEIYAALTEGGGEKKRLSISGGSQPRWRGDGKELYYVTPDGSVMAVAVNTTPRLETGAPLALFRVETAIENYDAAPDGQRFLVRTPAERSSQSPIRVALDWTAGLTRPR
ncbi:MAG TPA: protein kinase [Thermoanaerobaculia bacterium]|nr:protein kinase [Thermoanaerobaculia bacterium]